MVGRGTNVRVSQKPTTNTFLSDSLSSPIWLQNRGHGNLTDADLTTELGLDCTAGQSNTPQSNQ